MRRSLLLFLVFVCATASAKVFRRIGPDGQVYFSDQPGPDAEQVEVRPAQAISMPPVPKQTGAAQPQHDVGASYSEFAIVSPTSGQGLRANDGNVTVSLSLQPKLMPGHTVMLNVDGEDGEQIKTGGGLTIELSNLSRGLHTVEATVIDAQGKALIQTGPVSFNVLRVAVGGR
jgi:hypothetical protein